MKKRLLWLIAPLMIGASFPSVFEVPQAIESPVVYVKTSQKSAASGDVFWIHFFGNYINDFYGFQIDVLLSPNVGGLALAPIDESAPFELLDRNIFKDDIAFVNEFDNDSDILSFLVTRQTAEGSGYSVANVSLFATVQVRALAAIADINAAFTVSDDLLAMQLGQTNMTVKLSDSNGAKIDYALVVPDDVAPVITLTQATATISPGGSFAIAGQYTATDDVTPSERLFVATYSYENLNLAGEYLFTIYAEDEFLNHAIALFKLVVGDPYVGITISARIPS